MNAIQAIKAELKEMGRRQQALERALVALSGEAEIERSKYEAEVREAQTWLDRIERDMEHAKESAARLDKVPCRGEGDFAVCPLIAAAAKAKGTLADGEIEHQDALARVAELAEQPAEVKAIEADLEALGEQTPKQPDTRSRSSLAQIAKLEETIQYAIADASALCERQTVHECHNWGRALLRRLGAALEKP